MPEQDGLTFPKDTPAIIIDEAIKHVPDESVGYAYHLVEHIRTDIYVYSMVISEDWIHYMVTFYHNQNYDDSVLVAKIRIDIA